MFTIKFNWIYEGQYICSDKRIFDDSNQFLRHIVFCRKIMSNWKFVTSSAEPLAGELDTKTDIFPLRDWCAFERSQKCLSNRLVEHICQIDLSNSFFDLVPHSPKYNFFVANFCRIVDDDDAGLWWLLSCLWNKVLTSSPKFILFWGQSYKMNIALKN